MITLFLAAGMFDALRNADAHLATVAWRLQTQNAALCRDLAPVSGLVVQTLDQYAPQERADAMHHGLGDAPQISAVASGSPAEQAGLRPGNEILAIDGVPTPRASAAKARYDSAAKVEEALQAALRTPPAILRVRDRDVRLEAVPGCRATVQVVPGGRFDASADSRYVQISGAMFEFLRSDDELAFVVAHELAHLALGHSAMRDGVGVSGGPLSGFGESGRHSRAMESAADELAVRMMARAGYDLDAIIPFLLRSKKRVGLGAFDGTHPSWRQRIVAIGRTVEGVRRLQTAGKPIGPSNPTVAQPTP